MEDFEQRNMTFVSLLHWWSVWVFYREHFGLCLGF